MHRDVPEESDVGEEDDACVHIGRDCLSLDHLDVAVPVDLLQFTFPLLTKIEVGLDCDRLVPT